MADDLLEGRVGEGVELHLDHRPHAVHGHAHRHPDDAGLGERGVEAAGLAELGGEPVGDPEDAAERSDVLTEHQHGGVLGHRVAQGPVEGLRHVELLVCGSCGLRCGELARQLAGELVGTSSLLFDQLRCGLGVDVAEEVVVVRRYVDVQTVAGALGDSLGFSASCAAASSVRGPSARR